MSYIEQSLSRQEKILALFGLHWIAWVLVWGFLAWSGLCIILAMVFLFMESTVLVITCLALAVPTLIMAGIQYIKIFSTEMGVTNKRIINKHGWISRKTDEMKIASVETVTINQGIIGRAIGYGDVVITGKGISDVVFKKIDDPMSVKIAIENVDAYDPDTQEKESLEKEG